MKSLNQAVARLRKLRRALRQAGNAIPRHGGGFPSSSYSRHVFDPSHSDRVAGDIARDKQQWFDAADHYKRYLTEFPSDHGIWVQLGHVYGEMGSLPGADEAYAAAILIEPNDADAHLHYGRVKKRRGELEVAVEAFCLSADLSLTADVVIELGASDVYGLLEPSYQQMVVAAASNAIAPLCESLVVLDTYAVVSLGNNRFELTATDAWIEFQLSQIPKGSLLAALELSLTWERDKSPSPGHLDIRRSDVYDGEFCHSIKDWDDQVALFALVDPKSIRAFRWYPWQSGNVVRLDFIKGHLKFDTEVMLNDVLACYFHSKQSTDTAKEISAVFKRGEFRNSEHKWITRFLSPRSDHGAYLYRNWFDRWVKPNQDDYKTMQKMLDDFIIKPKFSFVVPVYNTEIRYLRECIDSMLAQNYQNFEICICDDSSPDGRVWSCLENYARQDDRVKIVRRSQNGHIAACSNSALSLATGDFIVLVDHDDVVPDYALFVVAYYVNKHPDVRIFFSDEDKMTPYGLRYDAYFKGIFNRFLLYGQNMVSHLGIYQRKLMDELGGFRLTFEGSQDYDLILRGYEAVGEAGIVHIPHILYHWRAIPGSTAVSPDQKGYAISAAMSAINGHFERTGSTLRSVTGFAPGVTGVGISKIFSTKISIIIPTRDGVTQLKPCIDSILENFDPNIEIIVVNNGSICEETLDYLRQLTARKIAIVIDYPGPFNFSDINNIATANASGEIYCFLNDDTEVKSGHWLARARALLAEPDVGIVGARLLYPDGTLQHFGVVTGTGKHGIAGHSHLGRPQDDAGYFGKGRLIQEVTAVTAACLFIKADLYKAVGGFEIELSVAYNDVDLCLKVRKAGFKIVADPDIVLIHKESKTRGEDTGAKASRLNLEAEWMLERWGSILPNDPYYSPNHTLENPSYGLAEPPRVPMPWQRDRA